MAEDVKKVIEENGEKVIVEKLPDGSARVVTSQEETAEEE
jgi:hypothetical protein